MKFKVKIAYRLYVLLVVVFLSGCAAPILSERVAQHSLGEIKFIYSEEVVTIWKDSGIALFEAKVREDIKAKLAEELTGEQPLHLYVNIQRVVMTRKSTQVVLSLFVNFHDLVSTTVSMFPGEAGVPASAEDLILAIAEGRGTGSYIRFEASTGNQLFSKWDVRIEKLAEQVARLVVKGVKYE